MMKIVSTLIILFLVTGCGHENIGLQGEWKLIKTSVPDPPSAGSISPGTIIWTFNERRHTIEIVDKTNPDTNDIKTIEYTIISVDTTETNNTRELFIKSNLGYIYLTKDRLTISKAHLDDTTYTFIR